MLDIQDALSQYVRSRQMKGVVPATVKAIDETSWTCTVEDVEGLEVYDVLLQCYAGEPGFQVIPAVGSCVLIGRLDASESWAVLLTGEIEKVVVTIGQTIVRFDNQGVALSKAGDSLAAMIGDLIDRLVALVIITPAGNGAVSPGDITALNALKTRFNSLLKDA